MTFFLYCFMFLLTTTQEAAVSDEDHAVYLSTIELVVLEGGVSMVVKVFEDDLRDALRGYYGHVIDTSGASFKQEVAAYMNHHISCDDGLRKLALSGSKVELVGDSYQVTMEAAAEVSGTELTISADYLMELFPAQQNVLHLTHRDIQKYHIFKKGGDSFVYRL